MVSKIWHKSKVIGGRRLGRKISVPTINLQNTPFMKQAKRGVYASHVRFGGKIYSGSLYFGPRTINREQEDVLEIHLLDFQGNLYGRTVEFRVLKFIRPPVFFSSIGEMKGIIEEDNRKISDFFRSKPSSDKISS